MDRRFWSRLYRPQYSKLKRDQLSFYQTNYGITRTQLNESFLGQIPREARILEVGCNSGNQLLMLQEMGFTNLSGVEVQTYALESARGRVKGVQLAQAPAFDLPYEDGYFDLVFTSGVLIPHLSSSFAWPVYKIHRGTGHGYGRWMLMPRR